MKKNVSRVIALVLTAVLVLVASACTVEVNVKYDDDTVAKLESLVDKQNSSTPVAVVSTESTTAPTTAPTTAVTPVDSSGTSSADTVSEPVSSDGPAAPVAGDSTDPAVVVAKYKEVLDQMKLTDKPAFKKAEYQELPEQYRDLGTVGNTILGLAGGFMTTKEKAESDPQISDPGSDMGRVPVNKATSCALTDYSAVKTASLKDNGDGTSTITIVLNDEQDPEPIGDAASSPSNVGAMFTPMSRAEIESTLINDPKVSKVVKVNEFHLNYKECTATLVFENANNHVKSLNQVMNVDIKADAKVILVPINGGARLVNTMDIYDVVY